jgi:hypothetical protein
MSKQNQSKQPPEEQPKEQPQEQPPAAEDCTGESAPGGRFVVHGRVVNCNGEEIA